VPALDIDEPFALDDFHHHRLVNGLDDVALTLQHDGEITAYEVGRSEWLPVTTETI
jgi:3-isopropylmalate/(R)-2-methylmalate dehydratase small subunit